MKDIEFVIAKYTEDTLWVKDLSPYRVTIYDKSKGDLPNIGREAHTYLHHIICNYDKLADITVFLQGNPFDHMTITRHELADHVRTYAFDKTEPFFNSRRILEYTRLCNRTCSVVFGYDPGIIHYSDGAMWVVQKRDITARPLAFYQQLFKHLCIPCKNNSDGVINAWTMEGIWQYVFNPNIPISPSFLEAKVIKD